MTERNNSRSTLTGFFALLAAFLFPGWAAEAEVLALVQAEFRELEEIAARVRTKYASARFQTSELQTRAEQLGIKFSSHVQPEFRAAILDHLENPQARTDIDYMHLTWITPRDGDWHGRSGQMILGHLERSHMRLLATDDTRDGGNRVGHHLQFQKDQSALKLGEVAVLPDDPHAPIHPRIYAAADFARDKIPYAVAVHGRGPVRDLKS